MDYQKRTAKVVPLLVPRQGDAGVKTLRCSHLAMKRDVDGEGEKQSGKSLEFPDKDMRQRLTADARGRPLGGTEK